MNILVISDVHCFHSSKHKDVISTTRMFSDMLRTPRLQHPFEALMLAIEEERIKRPDFIVCPGDMTENCDKQGLITTWTYLKEISHMYGGIPIYATAGNHDVDSYNIHNLGHLEILRGIGSDYPATQLPFDNSFWSKHYYLATSADCLVLGINSCYNHSNPENAKLARVSHLDELEFAIKGAVKTKYKIAIVHHHPSKHSNMDIKYKDSDIIENGDSFIDLLRTNDFDILIHGHKHDARLNIINGLAILGSGSFSSRRNTVDIDADNLIHSVTIDAKYKGRVQSYSYASYRGWTERVGMRFPAKTGFGSTLRPESLAANIIIWLKSKEKTHAIYYTELISEFKEINYLTPLETTILRDILTNTHHLRFTPDFPDDPKYLENIESLWI